MGTSAGKIIKINSELRYGFIQVPKLGDVFFSGESAFDGTSFENLKVNDTVLISVTETERGLFAKTLSLSTRSRIKSKKPSGPEISV